MILTDRKLYVLILLAAILSAVALIMYAHKPSTAVNFAADTPIIQGLDVEKVGRIVITKGGKTATLSRQGDHFVIVDHSSYPASNDRINKLLLSLLDMRAGELVTKNPANHAELGVAAASADVAVVKMFASSEAPATQIADVNSAAQAAAAEKPIMTILLGKDVAATGAQYVRLDGQDAVYTTQVRPDVSAEFTQLINSSLVNVPTTDVEKVTVRNKDGSYTLAREGEKVKLSPMPEGKELKENVAQSTLEALSSLPVEDVMTTMSLESTQIAFDVDYTCQTKSYLTYDVRLGTKGEDFYVMVSCQGPSNELVSESQKIGEQDPKEKLEMKSTVLAAHDKAEAFNQANGQWIYKVSKWTAERLRRSAAELVDSPASPPGADKGIPEKTGLLGPNPIPGVPAGAPAGEE